MVARQRLSVGAGVHAQKQPRSGACHFQLCLRPMGTHGIDHIEDAIRVAEYGGSLGMTVGTVYPTKDPVVFGEGGPVLRTEFDTDA